MMRFILIGIFFSLGCKAQQPVNYYNLLVNKPISSAISNIKNPKIIPNSTARQYIAFGNVIQLGHGDFKRVLFARAGTGHLTGGVPVYNIYYPKTDIWEGYQTIRTDTMDNRDVWATYMDNDSIVIWSQITHNGLYGDWSSDIYQMRGDSNLRFTDTIRIKWGATPRLQRGVVFGEAANTSTPGEYFIPLFQFNVDTGNLSRVRVDMIHTTNYFRTYSFVNVFAGTSFPVSEGWVERVGSSGDSMLFLLRVDLGSQIYTYNSSDHGVTWVAKGASTPLWWYNEGDSYIPSILRTNDTTVHIIYTNRDNDCIDLSPFNKPSIFFGTYLNYNAPEIYYYNRSEDACCANTSLGYVSSTPLIGDSIHLTTLAHEKTSDTAYIVYMRDNFKTDPAGIPPAPSTITPSSKTTTSFRVDISGYTQVQLNNIRYFQFDLSTDPAFGSFVTAKYQNPSTFGSVLLHNIRMTALWDVYNSLTTGTTYYLRIKACNNAGCSSFTTINVTTL